MIGGVLPSWLYSRLQAPVSGGEAVSLIFLISPSLPTTSWKAPPGPKLGRNSWPVLSSLGATSVRLRGGIVPL